MIPRLVVDLVYVALLSGVGLLASMAGLCAAALVSPAGLSLGRPIEASFAVGSGAAAFCAAWLATAALLGALLPRVPAGRHPLRPSGVVLLWMVHFTVRRLLDFPPMSLVLGQLNLVRFAVYRLMGCRLHVTTNMSSDALLLDPSQVTLGPDAVVGAQSLLVGHLVIGNELIVGPITIGARTQLGGQVTVAPGVRVGDDVRIDGLAAIGPGTTVGAGARIGIAAIVGSRCTIGARARVAPATYLPAGTTVPEGGSYP